MREEFFKYLWILVRLRYRLIWAQARASNGKIILLLSLYLVGGSVALLVAFGGLGAAIVDNDFDRGGFVARWTLTALFINGIGLSMMVGCRTPEGFSRE